MFRSFRKRLLKFLKKDPPSPHVLSREPDEFDQIRHKAIILMPGVDLGSDEDFRPRLENLRYGRHAQEAEEILEDLSKLSRPWG